MAVIANEKYGRLTTIEVVGRSKNRNLIWKCICDCGNYINLPTASLSSGNTQSCGCLHKDSMKVMGENIRILNKYDLTGEFGIGYTSKNETFYFDLEDYDKIKNMTWRYNPEKYLITNVFGKPIRMHMLLMNSDGSKRVHHINHITFDNKKSNLIICEHFENIIASKTYSNNTSGRKGVYWDKSRNKWMVILTCNKITYNLGRYDTFEEAVKVREEAEEKYHKEFKNN